MILKDLIQAAKLKNAAAFAGVEDKKAIAIVRVALSVIAKEAQEGKVAVPVLGRFVIKQSKKEKDGKEVEMRRVIFRAATGVKKAAVGKKKAEAEAGADKS